MPDLQRSPPSGATQGRPATRLAAHPRPTYSPSPPLRSTLTPTGPLILIGATGYSTLGVLVPLLSSTAIIKKEELQAQRKAEREALEKRWSTVRWWHDSTARRVTRAVADVLNPFDNFVNVKQII